MNIKIGDLVEQPTSSRKIKVYEPSLDNRITNESSAFVSHQLRTRTGSIPTDFHYYYFSTAGKTAFSANIAGAVKYLWVEQGKLTVNFASEVIHLKSGQMISFRHLAATSAVSGLTTNASTFNTNALSR